MMKTVVRAWTLVACLVTGSALSAAEAYVQSSGTQSVALDYFLKSTSRVEADFELVDLPKSSGAAVFGAWGATTPLPFGVWVLGSSGKFETRSPNGTSSSVKAAVGVRYRVVADLAEKKCFIYVGEALADTVDFSSSIDIAGDSVYPLVAFARCNSRVLSATCPDCFAKMKLFSLKIYEEGDPVKDFVPALKDGRVGLYDQIDGSFHTDPRLPWTGDYELGYGGKIMTVDPSVESGYLESDGTDIINSRMTITPDLRAEVDFALTRTTDLNQCTIFGSRTGSPKVGVYITGGKYAFAINENGTDHFKYSDIEVDTLRHRAIIDCANKTVTFATCGAANYYVSTLEFGQSADRPLGLFGDQTGANGLTSRYQAPVRIYRARFYRGATLVHDYVPCLKGGMPGLKDLVKKDFVTGENLSAYSVGGKVSEEMDAPYIASPDNWIDRVAGKSVYLDTGYTVGPKTRVELDYALLTPDWAADNLYKSADNNPNPFLLDASSASPYMGIYLYGGSATAGCYAYQLGTGSGNLDELRLNTAYGVRRTVVMDSNTVAVITSGFTNFVKSVAAGKELKTTLNTLKIASRNNLSRFLPVRVYGLRIYEADALQKDYRPFVKDMKPGLVNALDETDRIYTSTYSSQGVRTDALFTPGGAIAGDESLAGAYLEFDLDGTHNINTGYVVTKDSCIEIDLALWCTDNTTQQFYFEQRGYKKTAAECNGVWARLYMSGSNFAYQFKDYPSSFSGTVMFAVNQERTKFKFDAYNNRVSAERCGETVFDQAMVGTRTAMTCTSPLYIGSNWSGSNNSGLMRLYGFKISEAGTAVHNYVPYRRGTEVGLYDVVGDGGFLPLVGGRVSGANTGADEFQIFPQDTKLEVSGTDTFRCLAAGAVSYRWYCNGVQLLDETGETLTVVWRKGSPRTDTYAVVPVYEVYCNPVLGARATATVEHSVRGMSIILR